MKERLLLGAACLALLGSSAVCGEATGTRSFRGVVTSHLIPAKVMRVNRIVEDPEPGTSYIGEEGILVELNEDVEVTANWTVVEIEYYEYEAPKTIDYRVFSEDEQVTVEHHAVSVDVVGVLSDFVSEK